MSNDINLLYPRVKEMTMKLLDLTHKSGHDGRIMWTTRTVQDEIDYYGKEVWTNHYIGLAVDWYPDLHCTLNEWQNKFNHWPFWDLVQCDIAVKAGFDRPCQWQLQRDRCHMQVLFGKPESYYRDLWYVKKMNKEQIWKELDKCLNPSASIIPDSVPVISSTPTASDSSEDSSV